MLLDIVIMVIVFVTDGAVLVATTPYPSYQACLNDRPQLITKMVNRSTPKITHISVVCTQLAVIKEM